MPHQDVWRNPKARLLATPLERDHTFGAIPDDRATSVINTGRGRAAVVDDRSGRGCLAETSTKLLVPFHPATGADGARGDAGDSVRATSGVELKQARAVVAAHTSPRPQPTLRGSTAPGQRSTPQLPVSRHCASRPGRAVSRPVAGLEAEV